MGSTDEFDNIIIFKKYLIDNYGYLPNVISEIIQNFDKNSDPINIIMNMNNNQILDVIKVCMNNDKLFDEKKKKILIVRP